MDDGGFAGLGGEEGSNCVVCVEGSSSIESGSGRWFFLDFKDLSWYFLAIVKAASNIVGVEELARVCSSMLLNSMTKMSLM